MYKKITLSGLILLFVLCVYYLISNISLFSQNPFERNIYFEAPSFVTTDPDNNIYIVDKGMRRVIKVNPDNSVTFMIDGGNRTPGSFYYAKELTVDQQSNLFLLSNILDEKGIFTTKEEILQYNSAGGYTRAVFSVSYEKENAERDWTLIRKGRILGLKSVNGSIYWFLLNKQGMDLYKFDGKTSSVIFSYRLPDAYLFIADASIYDEQKFAYSTKKGEVFEYNIKNRSVRNCVSNMKGGVIPWEIGYGRDGNIYFTDLYGHDIKQISQDNISVSLFSRENIAKQYPDPGSFIFYTMDSISNGNLATVIGYSLIQSSNAPALSFDTHVITADSSGKVISYISSAKKSIAEISVPVINWLLLFLTAGLFYYILVLIYRDILQRKLPSLAMQVMGILLIIIASSFIVSNMVFKNFTNRYQTDTLNNIAQMVQTFSQVIDTGRLEKLSGMKDYMNDDYKIIRKQVHTALNFNKDSWNEGYYIALYKVKDNNVYAVMYYNDQVSQYPFVDYSDPTSFFYRVYNGGEILTDKISSFEGDFLYGMGPIRNRDGKIIAVIEVGTDMYGFTEENVKLVKSLVIEIVTMLVILMLALIEVSYFANIIRRYRESVKHETVIMDNSFSYLEMVRPLSFLISIGIFSSMAFIPIMMGRINQPVFNLPKNIVLGLPVACEMLSGGAGILIASHIVDRSGWKKILYAGFIIFGIGSLLSGFSEQAYSLILSRSVAGLGSGFILMGLRSFVNTSTNFDERTSYYAQLNSGTIAGLNIGVIVGALMADNFGFSTVFFLALIISALSYLFCINLIKERRVRNRLESSPGGSISTLRFIIDRKVLAFFMFMVFPTCVALSFMNYMLPVYAESIGLTASDVGRGFILNGLIVIYLGPYLSSYFYKKFGAKVSAFVSVFILGLSLVVFGTFPSITGAFITVALLGLGMSFGASLQNEYFLRFEKVAEYGEGRAVGVYEIFGKIGDMAGPLIFGFLTIMSVSSGVITVGIGIIVAILLFILVNPRKKVTQ